MIKQQTFKFSWAQMMNISNHLHTLISHDTKRESLYKYLLLLSVLIAYFGYLSWEYGLATGGMVAALTWSFFVLCTPVADAGFLLDFPVRLITGLKMLYTEIIVWVLAASINIIALTFYPQSYDKTVLTNLFHQILVTPWPYWGIIVICAAGTFLSVLFGDEMLDVLAHRDKHLEHQHGFKHKIIAMAALFSLIIVLYYELIASLGIEIPME